MLGVYVHLPFCRVHCAYCPFAVSTDLSLQEAYIAALLREIEVRAGGESVDTIFFGGGTPSRTDRAHLQSIAEATRTPFRRDADAELSSEADPDDVPAQADRFLRSLGIHR